MLLLSLHLSVKYTDWEVLFFSQTEQIALLEEVVRPQLLNELKRSKEEAQSKKLKYDALIDKYETLWQEYEVC